MDSKYLETLANRVIRKLRNGLPLGVDREDAFQDACLEILRWADKDPPEGVDKEAFLVMKGWGTLTDKYTRMRQNDPQAHWTKQRRLTPWDRTKSEGSGEDAVALNPKTQAPSTPETADTTFDVRSAIDRLTEPGRSMVLLELDGLNYTEIGAKLGYHRSWVSRVLTAAKAQLAELLEDYQ